MNDANRSLNAAGTKFPLAGHVLDLGSDELRGPDGAPVELRPQAFQVLRFLALNAGRVVGKDELHAAVWPGLVVTDDSLVQAVSDLRRALGDAQHRLIKTVPRRGYTLVADAVAAPAVLLPLEERRGATAAPPRRGRPALLPALLTGALLSFAAWVWYGTVSGESPPSAGTAQAMPDRPSIAVVAFHDPGGDAAAQQLARGVATDVVAQLARNVDLRVVSTASSFALADRGLSSAEIGRQLRSRYLVDGTVRRDGELLRVDVNLIDSEDGHVVWSAQHAADNLNVLATRDALAQRVAGTLHSRLRQSEERRVLARPPKTLDVYTMTLRALALKHQFRPDATREARQLLERAIEIDPDYAPAWLYLGMLNGLDSLLRLTGEWHPGRYDEMLAQSRRAVELDPQLPAAWFSLALVHVEGGRLQEALAAMRRCVALGPGDADCHMYLAVVQSRLGQGSDALASIERALELSPIVPAYMNAAHARVLWVNRRLEDALRPAETCLDQAPRYVVCRMYRLLALSELGRAADAAEEARRLGGMLPGITTANFAEKNLEVESLRSRAVAAARAAGIPPAP
ncbi:winged helix-turn-helix domain-containing protein [uncultured Piscinibacter sp.]|uniref:winged helix-turn-helix domain-containing protein n=1 Tax=uncultured Piscinibacter sp. TaxID=1131835 RepID=UPI002631DEF0|nr:winged helix-turn-helix domain-containing protein [uncultured Piscinibacter sp.]